MVRMVPRVYKKKKWKIVFCWIMASLFMLFGSITASEARISNTTNELTFLFMLLLSLISFLIAGLFWISIALAFRKLEE